MRIKVENKAGQVVIAVLLIVGALVFASFPIRDLLQVRSQAGFASTTGRFTSMEEPEKHYSGRRGTSVSYTIKSTYAFEVDGASYVGEQIGAFRNSQNVRLEEAQSLQSSFAHKAGLTVKYNPSNPADCYLEMKDTDERNLHGRYFLTIVPGLVAFVGLVALIRAIRS